jgi:hypothetical protein
MTVVWIGDPLAAHLDGIVAAGIRSPPSGWFLGPVAVDPADGAWIAGKYREGVAVFDGTSGAMHTLRGIRAVSVLGLLDEWVTVLTVGWVNRIHCRTGECENVWWHGDPTLFVDAQPCYDGAMLTLWAHGKAFTGLVVHQFNGVTNIYPVNLPAATVCVGWRETCSGTKSGYVCTADKRVASFLLELDDPPDTCHCLHLQDSSGEMLFDHRYQLPSVPTCAAVVTEGGVDTVHFGMLDSMLVVRSTPELVVSTTAVGGGVQAVSALSKNAFILETVNGQRKFTIDVDTNVATLSP